MKGAVKMLPKLNETKPTGETTTASKPAIPLMPSERAGAGAKEAVEVAKQPYISVPGGLPGIDPSDKFRYLNVLIYALSGVGKTTLTTTACDDPRTSPILVIDFEGGAELRFKEKDPTTYTIRQPKSMDDVSFLYNYLVAGNHPYKSVSLDSLTEIQKLGLYEFVWGADVKKSGPFGTNAKITDIKTAEIQHWGKSLTQMGLLVRLFKDLRIHTFFTCLLNTDKDETTGKIFTTVALPGKQALEIPGIPDIVMRYFCDIDRQGNTRRVGQFQPTSREMAKDRTDALGNFMEEPTVTKMLNMIWGKYGITE
jgi:hypothetical protein